MIYEPFIKHLAVFGSMRDSVRRFERRLESFEYFL